MQSRRLSYGKIVQGESRTKQTCLFLWLEIVATFVPRDFAILYGLVWASMNAAKAHGTVAVPLRLAACVKGYVMHWADCRTQPA